MRRTDDYIEKARTSDLLLQRLVKGKYTTNGTVFAVKYVETSTVYAFVSSINPEGYRNSLKNDAKVQMFANIGYIYSSRFTGNESDNINWER